MNIRIVIACASVALLAACQPQAKTAEAPPAPVAPAAPAAAPDAQAAAADAVVAPKSTITVDLTAKTQPAITQKLSSPLQIDGVVPAAWVFEASFPVTLAVDGKAITQAEARTQDDWTNGKPTHPYRSTVTFTVTAETKAQLVFEPDMPALDASGNETPSKTVVIPVTLVPAG